ncbi:flagellar basal body L-ring protein FlgH [Buchnera aphidicola (Kurisakia onigurumii)]|uniref:flagellar basal body L-ring protein FlgH n=1 Tax=Buchnera aphidicola TaxID=9 RepID=UPI0031B68CB5
MSKKKDKNYYSLFENQKKYHVGDIITISLEENIRAKNNSFTNSDNTTNSAFGLNSFPLFINKIFKINYNKAVFDQSNKSFDSNSGTTGATDSLKGLITVTVTKILENGNIQVAGEKQIGINNTTEYIRFTGVINPKSIEKDNIVSSNKVANTYIEYTNTGYDNSYSASKWLKNWFLSLLPV